MGKRLQNRSAHPAPLGRHTLFVVPCTKKKIWEAEPHAPKYVAAREAYKGHTMTRWLQSRWHKADALWVILSAKYGFIDPDQPISNYDVTFHDDCTGPLSADSLRAQIECQRRGRNRWRLGDIRRVRVWGDDDLYFDIVKYAFSRTSVQVTRMPT